jgi:hypothetical protein
VLESGINVIDFPEDEHLVGEIEGDKADGEAHTQKYDQAPQLQVLGNEKKGGENGRHHYRNNNGNGFGIKFHIQSVLNL